MVNHVGEDALGGGESEGCGVADVQLQDLVPFGLQPLSLDQDRTPDVIPDVLQLLGLDDATHGGQSRSRDGGGSDRLNQRLAGSG